MLVTCRNVFKSSYVKLYKPQVKLRANYCKKNVNNYEKLPDVTLSLKNYPSKEIKNVGVSMFKNVGSHQIKLNQEKCRKYGIRNSTTKQQFDASSIVLLSIPVISFGLGCWQVKRMKWKKDLIASLKAQGQNYNIRDEHFSYVLTWFSLSGITLAMWVMRFFR